MAKFKRDSDFSGKKKFGGDRDFKRGGRSESSQTMHKATCSECGKNCEVPFKPTGEKPIFCSWCFANKDTSNKSRAERRSSGRPDHGEREMFKVVCDKCHKSCEVPFRPTGDKAVFCSDCFGSGAKSERGDRERSERGGHNNSVNLVQHKGQIEKINTKLDKILEILEAHISVEPEALEEKDPLELVEEKTKKKVIAVKTEKKSTRKVAKKSATKKKAPAPKKAAKKAVAKKKKK